jgi:hypothetical protein
MPMNDAQWPEDALTPEGKARLVKEMTGILIEAEGYDAASPIAQRVAVFHLHRPAAVISHMNEEGETGFVVINHRPLNAVLLFSRLMWERVDERFRDCYLTGPQAAAIGT